VAQLQVRFGVATSVPRCDDDGPAQLAEELAALGVNGAFLMLDRCPVRMSRHGSSFAEVNSCLERGAEGVWPLSVRRFSTFLTILPRFGRRGEVPSAPRSRQLRSLDGFSLARAPARRKQARLQGCCLFTSNSCSLCLSSL